MVVEESYANLFANAAEPSVVRHKVYVRGHIYYFSPKVISHFLKAPAYEFNEIAKEYNMDVVASESMGELVD